MEKNEKDRPPKLSGHSESEKLDVLNAMLREGNSADRVRRSIEAQIDTQSKKRRGKEKAASSSWKHSR